MVGRRFFPLREGRFFQGLWLLVSGRKYRYLKSKSRTKLSCCSTRPSNSVLFVAVWLWTAEDSRSTCDFSWQGTGPQLMSSTFECWDSGAKLGRIITKVLQKLWPCIMRPQRSDIKQFSLHRNTGCLCFGLRTLSPTFQVILRPSVAYFMTG